MKNAKVVLGPHGGAFSNLIYCSIETVHPVHVIEFVPLRPGYKDFAENPHKYLNVSQYANNNYYGFANWLGMRYWNVEPARYDHGGHGMIVPVDKVLSILDIIGLLVPKDQWKQPSSLSQPRIHK